PTARVLDHGSYLWRWRLGAAAKRTAARLATDAHRRRGMVAAAVGQRGVRVRSAARAPLSKARAQLAAHAVGRDRHSVLIRDRLGALRGPDAGRYSAGHSRAGPNANDSETRSRGQNERTS